MSKSKDRIPPVITGQGSYRRAYLTGSPAFSHGIKDIVAILCIIVGFITMIYMFIH